MRALGRPQGMRVASERPEHFALLPESFFGFPLPSRAGKVVCVRHEFVVVIVVVVLLGVECHDVGADGRGGGQQRHSRLGHSHRLQSLPGEQVDPVRAGSRVPEFTCAGVVLTHEHRQDAVLGGEMGEELQRPSTETTAHGPAESRGSQRHAPGTRDIGVGRCGAVVDHQSCLHGHRLRAAYDMTGMTGPPPSAASSIAFSRRIHRSGHHPERCGYSSSRRLISSITSARLRLPLSAALKWLPMRTETASRQRTSTSSSSGQKAENRERR